MCGRFALDATRETISAALAADAIDLDGWSPRYNIAPTQDAPVLRIVDGLRRVDPLRWGLVPSWAKDASVGSRMINARAETVAEKPAYRRAFADRRCIVPASGFYEWTPSPDGRQPHLIRSDQDALLLLAGLWESWTDPDGVAMDTFTILTRNAEGVVRELHDRMPVMLAPDDARDWLSPGASIGRLQAIANRDGMAERMRHHPVARKVNSPANDSPDLLDRVDDSLFSPE